jgi:stage II sporulation protein R
MRHSHHSNSFLLLYASKITLAGFAFFLGLSALIGQFASANSGKLIPEDAIRIRIIANSDNDVDQQLKYKVRDDVAAFIESWGVMPSSHEEARQVIKAHLPEIQQYVDARLREGDASYSGTVELAKVPFPDKMFGGTRYSAGDYEALRITLGQGAGKNWWCVLFPPLCLTAATAADDDASPSRAKPAADKSSPAGDEPHAKFFIWEIIKKLIAFLSSLFS